VVLRFIAPPFGLWDGRDGTGRPASCNAGSNLGRRVCRSDLKAWLRRCVHDATFAHDAEEPLKPG
jgi:hypothetical protein